MALSTIGTNSIADSAVTTAKSTANITMVNQWRITTSFTQSAGESDITSNWELVDTNSYGSIGSNMTESSGIFTFPSTGVYNVIYRNQGRAEGAARLRLGGRIKVTTNNSSYSTATFGFTSATNNLYNFATFMNIIIDVTDTSNTKVKFTSETDSSSGSAFFDNESGITYNAVTFIRYGDT